MWVDEVAQVKMQRGKRKSDGRAAVNKDGCRWIKRSRSETQGEVTPWRVLKTWRAILHQFKTKIKNQTMYKKYLFHSPASIFGNRTSVLLLKEMSASNVSSNIFMECLISVVTGCCRATM